MLNLINKTPKDPDAPKPPAGSRSEREAKIKDKAGMVINVFALLLAINAYFAGTYSSLILNNTIKANATWAFYQAKSMKQTMAEYAREDAAARKDEKRVAELTAKIDRYENEPKDGKRDLMTKALALEAERDAAKQRSPWMSYASTAFQLSIVLLSASILAVSMPLFWGSFVVAALGAVLMSQGLCLWLPL
jgi:tellurite resistance protein